MSHHPLGLVTLNWMFVCRLCGCEANGSEDGSRRGTCGHTGFLTGAALDSRELDGSLGL